DGQRHQREDVNAVAEQVHHRATAHQGERHGDAGDGGGAPVAQEGEDHQHHQQDGDDQRPLHVVDGGADGGRAVLADDDVHRRRNGGAQGGELGDHPVHGVEDVGPGLAEDGHGDRRLAVGRTGVAVVGGAVVDVGDILQAHRSAVAPGDDQRLVLGGGEELVGDVDLEAVGAGAQHPLGAVGIGVVEHLADLLQVDAQVVELAQVD